MSSTEDYPDSGGSAAARRPACALCPLLWDDFPVRLSADQMRRLSAIVEWPPTLARGEDLFRSGDPLSSIYVVRAGAIKSYDRAGNGQPVTTGFFLPGELVGLDAIAGRRHPEGAKAVDTTSLCLLPYDRLLDLASQMPALLERLLAIYSQELRAAQRLLRVFGRRTGRERVAALLLSLSERFARRGLSATQLHLPMTRADMADYLGLAPETLSRIISQFEARGVLRASGSDLDLENLPALRSLVPDWRADHEAGEKSARRGRSPRR